MMLRTLSAAALFIATLTVPAGPAVGSVLNTHHAIGSDMHEVPPTGMQWSIGFLDGETRMDVLPVEVPVGCELNAQIDVAGDPRSAWVRVDGDDEGRWSMREPSRRLKIRNRSNRPMRADLVVAAFGKKRSRVDTRLSLRCNLN